MTIIKFNQELSYEYEYSYSRHSITLYWNDDNNKLHKKMSNAFDRFEKNTKDMNWVKILIAISEWKCGEKLYIQTRHHTTGCMNIWFEKKPIMIENLYCVIIDEDGFINMNFWNQPFNGTATLEEVSCDYNTKRATLDWI